ncbi:hypothetical protein BT96DRAFT_987931 [Gymnopus androsaceus JB14]|uniref:Uncharacterized protein n=1 Tax=Gymnopus androsaceus JB14 TaxID=1447944 RepID=A0A6A4I5Z0_9AGAR|nr:hypothetical protein BT96DRAFT_987931 [Gymnopus androsaceus JB14]
MKLRMICQNCPTLSKGSPSCVRNSPRAPSTVAQEKKEHFAYCGRPVTADKPLPATLMNPILCEFQYYLRNSVPETQDILIFRKLRACLTCAFKAEDQRKAETNPNIGPYKTDGDLGASVEPADGQDSEFMNHLHQFLYYAEEEHQAQINFPAILIGPQLAVSAAAFAGSPNVETLVSIPLNIHSTNTESYFCWTAITFQDIPFRNFYEIDGKKHDFVYEHWEGKRRKLRGTKRIYHAYKKEGFKRILVKFTCRYSEDTH